MRFNQFKILALVYTLFLTIILVTATGVQAQSKTSAVRGMVQNGKQQPLAGVAVTLKNTSTNYFARTITDSTGIFSFSKIASGGPYNLNFSMIGYEPQALGGYKIKEGITLSLVVKLDNKTFGVGRVVKIKEVALLKKNCLYAGADLWLLTTRFPLPNTCAHL